VSGIDEQILDTPLCPLCGNRPSYWTLSTELGAAIWLFSVEYRFKYNEDFRGWGEVKFGCLNTPLTFIKAACMGGCGARLVIEEEPVLFEKLNRVLEKRFSNLRRTD